MHNTMAYNPMNQDKYKMIPKSHLISNIFNLAIFWNFLKLFPRSDAGVDKWNIYFIFSPLFQKIFIFYLSNLPYDKLQM